MLKDVLKTAWQEGLTDKDADQWFSQIEEMVSKRNLVTVYDAGSGRVDGGDYLDGAILKALFKSTSGEELADNGLSELKLALSWNRIDLVKDVFKDPSTCDVSQRLTSEHFAYLLPFALEKDRIDFVNEFLANGLDASEFMTIERLNILYNKSV